jgi:hypothetical protein
MNDSAIFSLRCRQHILLTFLYFTLNSIATAAEPIGTRIEPGSHIGLEKPWPNVRKALKSEIATIEVLVCPDQATIERPRSFIITLSNSRGSDSAGLGLTIKQACVVSNVFGTRLRSMPLNADEWTHVALTVNTKTINKRARLWINGKLVQESLILEHWPGSFAVTRMLSDKWNQGRVFSGKIGDVRISKTVRYTKPFEPPTSLPEDKQTTLRLDGRRLPLE